MTGSARQAAIQAQLAYKMKRLVTEADFDRSAHVGPVSELRLPAHDSLLLRHLEAALKSSFNGDVVSLNRVVHVDDVGDDDPWTESVKDHARWHGIEMDEQTETRAANNDIVVFSTILRCRSPQPSQPPKSPKSPSLGFHTPPPMSPSSAALIDPDNDRYLEGAPPLPPPVSLGDRLSSAAKGDLLPPGGRVNSHRRFALDDDDDDDDPAAPVVAPDAAAPAAADDAHDGDGEACSICQTGEPATMPTRLGCCTAVYCFECIKQWGTDESNTCPNCRK